MAVDATSAPPQILLHIITAIPINDDDHDHDEEDDYESLGMMMA